MSLTLAEEQVTLAELQIQNINGVIKKYKGLQNIPANKLIEEKEYLVELLTIAVRNLNRAKEELVK